MEGFEVRHPGTLVDALTMQGGYTTRTRARKAIKNGAVKVEGNVIKIPSTVLEPGMNVTHDRGRKTVRSASSPGEEGSNRTKFERPEPKFSKSTKPPFDVVFEDDNFLAYIKPSGWIVAAPNPNVRTAYSNMKNWLEHQNRGNHDLHFVNKIMKDVSGICLIAKNRVWREHLQENWNDFRQGIYILVEGHLPPDDQLECREEDGEPVQVQYRTMRATQKHTLLKVDAPMEAVHLIMPSLRREGCIIVGKGKTAPDPLKREGVHMFALEVTGPKGEEIMIKSRVPKEFLGLMKGGDVPKPGKRRNAEVKFGNADRGQHKLKQRMSHSKTTENTSEKTPESVSTNTTEKIDTKTPESVSTTTTEKVAAKTSESVSTTTTDNDSAKES